MLLKKTSAILAVSILLLASCTKLTGPKTIMDSGDQTSSVETTSPAIPAESTEIKELAYSEFDTETEQNLQNITTSYKPTAVQVAFLDWNTIYTYCYGYAEKYSRRAVTDDTKYRIASLSKLITAMVFMAAQDRGLVDDETDISEYFGEPCYNPLYKNIAITPSMLMTHLSSVASEIHYILRKGLLSSGRFYLSTEPGKTYSYSNTGYGTLSCLLERVTQQPFPDLAEAYLFDPMQIDAAYTWDRLDDGTDIGALYGESGGMTVNTVRSIRTDPLGMGLRISYGNLLISAKDYVKLLGLLMYDGRDFNGKQILSSYAVNEMLERRFTQNMFGVAYGSQIQTNVIEGTTVYVHTGSANGMFSAFVFDPKAKKAAVVLSTGEGRRMNPDNEIYSLCLDLITEAWGQNS